jgi:hypothetical protein
MKDTAPFQHKEKLASGLRPPASLSGHSITLSTQSMRTVHTITTPHSQSTILLGDVRERSVPHKGKYIPHLICEALLLGGIGGPSVPHKGKYIYLSVSSRQVGMYLPKSTYQIRSLISTTHYLSLRLRENVIYG